MFTQIISGGTDLHIQIDGLWLIDIVNPLELEFLSYDNSREISFIFINQ